MLCHAGAARDTSGPAVRAAAPRLTASAVTSLVGLCLVLGAGLSIWATRFIPTLLYGLDARDPATFVWAAALLMAVAAVAAWPPARRASRIDPMRVLRNS